MTLLPTPRELYPNEQMVWSRLKQRFDDLTKTVRGLISTAEVAAHWQQWLTQNDFGPMCFDETDQRIIDGILHRYNTLGRIISGAELGKYNVQIKDGDVDIGAPPGMSPDLYTPDIYPGAMNPQVGLGGIILVVGVIAVALVVGAVVAVTALNYAAKGKDHDFRKKVIDTDKEMMTKDKQTRDAWIAMKKSSAKLIEKANKEHGSSWLSGLGVGGAAGLVVVILGLILASKIAKQ